MARALERILSRWICLNLQIHLERNERVALTAHQPGQLANLRLVQKQLLGPEGIGVEDVAVVVGTMCIPSAKMPPLVPMVTREMYQTIDMLHREKGLTVVMISHDLDAALRQGDRILHLSHDGIFLGTPEGYCHSPLGQRFVGGCSHD